MSDTDPAATEHARRCARMWAAVIERARRDARGEGLSYAAHSEAGQRAARVEAQRWLESIGATPSPPEGSNEDA